MPREVEELENLVNKLGNQGFKIINTNTSEDDFMRIILMKEIEESIINRTETGERNLDPEL